MSKITEVAELVEKGKAKLVGAAVQAHLTRMRCNRNPQQHDRRHGCCWGEVQKRRDLCSGNAGSSTCHEKGVEVLKPHLASGATGSMGKLIIATVAGDLHDIGKNLVAMMIESAGFEVIDLGVDVPASKIIECYKENPDVKVIALSALLTTTMPSLKDTVAAINAEDFRSKVKVMVGGAPITDAFANEIGADGYSEDAASAAVLAKALVA